MIENVSESAKNYMDNSTHRNIDASIKANASNISGEIRSLSYRKGSCGGSYFQPASIFSNSLTATVYDGSLRKGSKIELYHSVPESGDSTEYKVMTGYVKAPADKGTDIVFTAEGAITAKLGVKYTSGVGSTINEMLNVLSAMSGVSVSLENGLDGSYAPNQNAELKGYLAREVLGYIAGCFFGYATEDVNGNIVIRQYKSNAENCIELKKERMKDYPDVYDTVTVEGIQIITSDENGQIDFVYPVGAPTVNCSLYNPLMTQELFDAYVGDFVGLTYTPFSAEMALGNFALEPWDSVIINGKQTMITEIKYTYDGGLKAEISASTLNSGEEYSRTEREMESNIAFKRYPTAIGNGGGSTGGGSEPDPSRYDLVKVGDGINFYIKDNAICTIEGYGTLILYNTAAERYVMEGKPFSLPAKLMPAYPVHIYFLGSDTYSAIPNTACLAQEMTILPELDNDGNVRTVLTTSWLDPKVYTGGWFSKYYYSDAYNHNLPSKMFTTFRVQYLLKSYVDSLNEGSESE